jgi:3-phenylpropionate/cinnamic acid dioxygenase small subunit
MSDQRLLSIEACIEIEELLFRFMASFDEKDWDAMRACLAETIDCDYSSFRGIPPGKIAREEYVNQRIAALASLKTQHNLSNLRIVAIETTVKVRCNYAILRFHRDFDGTREKYFHSHGTYLFGVLQVENGWRIASIKQLLLVSDGNSSLHLGTAKS